MNDPGNSMDRQELPSQPFRQSAAGYGTPWNEESNRQGTPVPSQQAFGMPSRSLPQDQQHQHQQQQQQQGGSALAGMQQYDQRNGFVSAQQFGTPASQYGASEDPINIGTPSPQRQSTGTDNALWQEPQFQPQRNAYSIAKHHTPDTGSMSALSHRTALTAPPAQQAVDASHNEHAASPGDAYEPIDISTPSPSADRTAERVDDDFDASIDRVLANHDRNEESHSTKRRRLSESVEENSQHSASAQPASNSSANDASDSVDQSSYKTAKSADLLPSWMRKQKSSTKSATKIVQPSTPARSPAGVHHQQQNQQQQQRRHRQYQHQRYRQRQRQDARHSPHYRYLSTEIQFSRSSPPIYEDFPCSFTPTWRDPVPNLPILPTHVPSGPKFFELSLLSLSEFTITGLPSDMGGEPSSTEGLGSTIRKLSKQYGKAVYEKSTNPGVNEGRWRIPLEAYNEFYAFLSQHPMYKVKGIPRHQLNIASLGKAQKQKGYPSIKELVLKGVPPRLAKTLAPFQRGGVEFVMKKDGRALIADDMGLGKTIQAVASASVYHREWPVLVLTPSSARYHWEAEFQQWLGPQQSKVKAAPKTLQDGNSQAEDLTDVDMSRCMEPIRYGEINVLTSSKDQVLPNPTTKVVVCSYGLAPGLVDQGKIYPGLFQCAIVDESHMLKNIATQRTKLLVPVLKATTRCILLSGTPAFARPSELWPQLNILGTDKTGWWDNEQDFFDNYVKKSSTARRAELHALLTGTVMIRRLKNDILKTLPKKVREKVTFDVLSPEAREEMHLLMIKLRKGNGVLGQLAKQHSALGNNAKGIIEPPATMAGTKELLDKEYAQRLDEGRKMIQHTTATSHSNLNFAERQNMHAMLSEDLRRQLDVWRKERLHEINNKISQDNAEESRANTLNKMYNCTAKSKIPVIIDMVNKWLDDPAKGKLCLFAHHLFVLNDIEAKVGLSNASNSRKKFIRIDGSTSPKERQAQIKQFQSDPSIRIALLGITAAGVAVTLTASSTVWFAELFWTPALMIQAEDRCHRIGQSSRVNCVYFVAEGTLDELLWKLLEKKFRDLGEFVEGKEKQKLVVHKVYEGLGQFLSIFHTSSDFEQADDQLRASDTAKPKSEVNEFDMLGIADLEKDVEQLAQSELRTVSINEDPSDNTETRDALAVGDPSSATAMGQSNDTSETLVDIAGATEEEAIELSDDEDAADAETSDPVVQTMASTVRHVSIISDDGEFNANGVFGECKRYTVKFFGPKYGINLEIFHGRLVVNNRDGLEPSTPKPSKGDILILMNGVRVPFVDSMQDITPTLIRGLETGPVHLTFLENSKFASFYKRRLKAQKEMRRRQRRMVNFSPGGRQQQADIVVSGQGLTSAGPTDKATPVIEILD